MKALRRWEEVKVKLKEFIFGEEKNVESSGVAMFHRDERRPWRVGEQQPEEAQLCQLPCQFHSTQPYSEI